MPKGFVLVQMNFANYELVIKDYNGPPKGLCLLSSITLHTDSTNRVLMLQENA